MIHYVPARLVMISKLSLKTSWKHWSVTTISKNSILPLLELTVYNTEIYKAFMLVLNVNDIRKPNNNSIIITMDNKINGLYNHPTMFPVKEFSRCLIMNECPPYMKLCCLNSPSVFSWYCRSNVLANWL
jgi:hypothetical protein